MATLISKETTMAGRWRPRHVGSGRVIGLCTIVALVGCGSGPLLWSYGFNGQTKNLAGAGEAYDEEGFAILLGHEFIDHEGSLGIILNASPWTRLVILIHTRPPHPGEARLSTDDTTTEAWLLRFNPLRIRELNSYPTRDFVCGDRKSREENPLAFEMSGTVVVKTNRERITTIDVDLTTKRPMPMFREYLERRLVDRWLEESQRYSNTKPALIRGRFKGFWKRKWPWLFI